MYNFVPECEFGLIAVSKVEGFVLLWIEEFMLTLCLYEFLAAGQELANTFLPLSSIAHFVVLVHLLDYGLPVESLWVHPQNLQGLL